MARGFNLTAEINLRGPSNIRQVVADLRRQLGSIDTNINVQINQQTNRQITAIGRSFQDFNRTLQQTRTLADSTARSLTQLGTAARGLATNLQNIPQTMNQINQGATQTAQANTRAATATRAATSEFAEFGRQSALAVRRFAAFATVTGIIFKVSNAITSATQDFIEFNQQLIKVSQVTDTPVQSLGFLVSNITRLSTGLGVASQDLINVAQTLAQAGLSARDTSIALQALARSALAPSFDDLNSTVEGSIALMRQFGISASQLEGALGSINAVAAKFAVEASDIVTAISRTGGVFAAASKGVSQGTDALNEFIAVFTSVRATTRESAETIATGLRTIFTRIQREDTITALKAYGVALTDLEGKFVGPYEAVRRLAQGLSTLDPRDIRFSRIVEELGGFRQIGKVIPLIQQFTTAQQALNVAQQGQGSLAKDAATAQLSLANQMAKVREEFSALVRSIGQSQGFQDLVRLGLDLASAFIRVADAVKGALPALTAIFAIKGFQALTQFSRGFAGGLRTGAPNQRLNSGGYVHHFARGGVVPGTGNRDTVPAMLQPGEFVIRKKAVDTIGSQNLHRMNRYASGGKVQKFAKGGAPEQLPLEDQKYKGTAFAHIAPPITNKDFSPSLQQYIQTEKMDLSALYTNMGLDLPKLWNANWDQEPDNLGAFSQNFASYIASNDVFKTLKSGGGKGGKYRFTGRAKSAAQQILNQSYPAIQKTLADKVAATNKFYDTDAQDVYTTLPGLLKQSIVENLNKVDASKLISGFEEISVAKVKTETSKTYNRNKASQTIVQKQLQKQSLGGFIQRFVNGGTVEQIAASKGITITDAILEQVKAMGGVDGVKTILGQSKGNRTLNSLLQAGNIKAGKNVGEAQKIVDQALSRRGTTDAAEQERVKKLSKVAIAGLVPIGYSKDFEWNLTSGNTVYAYARGMSNRYRDAIEQMQKETAGAASRFAENLQYADIFSGDALAFDFDETLVSGTDILDAKGRPDIPRYSDRAVVAQYLQKGKPTRLLTKLKSLIDADPNFIKRTRILTARPQSTVDLLAQSLQSFGLPYQASDITGVGGKATTNVAQSKASNLAQLEKLIDDNLDNVRAAKASGKKSFLYSEPKPKPELDELIGQGNIEGAVVEKALALLGANLPPIEQLEANRAVDFPQGLGRAAQFFDIDPNIPTEVKRTLDGSSFEKARAEFSRYFQETATKFAQGGEATDTLEEYFVDSSKINLGLANSKSLPKEERSKLAKKVKDMRSLRTKAPETLYSSISRAAFNKFATDVGFNKNPEIPTGTKLFDQAKYYAAEVQQIIGKSFSLPGFVSTSKDFPKAKSFLDNAERDKDKWAAMLTIQTKPEAQGVDVAQQLEGRQINVTKQDINPRTGKMETFYMNPPSSENEVALSPRSKFRVNRAKYVELMGRHNLWADVQQFAKGGSAEDTVPALLTPGEFVINKKAASRIGASRLHALNRADKIQGYNKGGSVGFIQKFKDGGDVFEFPERALAKPTKNAIDALEQAIEKMMSDVVAQIAKTNPSISFDDAYAQASRRVLPESQFLPGVQQAAEKGDSRAGQLVYQQQQQQINTLIKQIRSTNNSISIGDARAAAEQRVAQAWGGLIQKVKQTTQSQQQLNTSTQQLTTAQNNSTAQQEADAGATEGRGGLNFSGLGTALAFTGPMLAQQIGDSIGGTTGAGIAGGATAFSTYASIGAQFGPTGAIIGSLAGFVAAVDGFKSAVAQKESELASIELDKAVEQSAQVRERFVKTGRSEDAGTLVTNFQKIQALEEKRVAANIKAEQPGMISSALNTVSFGYLGGDRRSQSQISGARTAEQQAAAQEAQTLISSMIAAGKSYDQVTNILQQQGVALSDLYSAIAEANPEYQAEVVAIQKSNMAEELKERAVRGAKQKYVDQARTLANAEFADAARAKASQQLAQKINVVSASMTRTFENLNQAINASSASLKQASDDLQRIVSGSTGFTANLDSLNVLQNPRAFGREQQNTAIRQGSQFAGRDRGFIEQLARFSLDAEDIVAGGAARAQQQGSNQAVVANDIINQLTQRIDAVFGQNTLGEELRNSLKEKIQESLKRGEEIDVQKLLEESGLSNQLQSSKQAFDALQNSLKLVQEAMNFAANAANEYGKLQQNIRDNQASYQNTITQSSISLKEALGKRVGIGERLQARRGVAATKAGIDPAQLNATDLSSRRDTLQKEVNAIRSALQNTANTFDTTIPRADVRFTALTKKLAETESALKATEQGLESLPGIIEGNINDIIGEIGRIQQELSSRQQAAGSFAEQLVGSTPQELAELNGTFNLLNNTLNGQITTINQSQAAQQAYFQALQNGSSQQEAYAAAQQAFAGQTKSALGLFNQLSQMSGLEGAEINTIRADLLENFAKAQGSGLQNNPMFQKMIELLRKPPEQSAEIQALQGMLKAQQAELATTTQKLNEGVLSRQKDILDSANQAFIKALNDVRVKFDTEQLRGAGFGLGTPGQATTATRLASGGVVYASDGTYVNYQSRGTDTVPAMLTPGEFVVNAKATKKNLGLLSAINSSAGNGKTFSRGGVVYAAGGADITYEDLDAQLQAKVDANKPSARRTNDANTSKPKPSKTGRFAKTRQAVRDTATALRANTNSIGSRLTGGFNPNLSLGTGSIANLADNAVAGTVRGVARNGAGIGTQLGTQLVLNAAGVDPDVAQGVGIGIDAARAVSSAPQGASTAFKVGRGASALAVNAGFDVVQTGAEFLYDRQAFDEKKRKESEESIGVIGGGLAGLSRPVNTIIRGGYTTSSYIESRSNLAASRETTQRMQDAGRSNVELPDREAKVVRRAGGREIYEGRSSAEITFIEQQAKLQNQINSLKAKVNRTAAENATLRKLEDDKAKQFAEQKKASATRNEDQLFVRTGTFFNSSTFDEAKLNAEIEREASYQRREDTARSEMAAEEKQAAQQQAQEQARIKAEEDARFDSEWNERMKRIERREAVGLKEWATDEDVTKAEEAKNQQIAKDNELKRVQQTRNLIYSEISTPNRDTENALFWSKRLPPTAFSKEFQKAMEERQNLNAEIAEERASTYDPNNPFIGDRIEWEKKKNERLATLYSKLNNSNNFISTEYKDKKYDELDTVGRQKLWEQYNAGQLTEAKAKQREEKQANTKLAKKQADQIRAVAKYMNMPVPDKFSNPGVFLTWRKTVQKRLQKDFPFGVRTPDALSTLGIPADMIEAVYNPFNSEELVSIYSSMLQNAPLSPKASQVVAALRMQQNNLSKKVENDPRLQQIISSASPAERQEITKQFETTFVKSARQIGVFERLVSRFQDLNPGQQKLAQANLYSQAAKQGLIDPRANNDFNISRLNALGGGNVASFLYPNQQTQNQAIRVSDKVATKNKGGIVYASNGMLVPYQPQGTDTVPAMLTPGEFVVNRAATQKHLPLLQSINRSRGGKVEYLEAGGTAGMTTDPTRYIDGIEIAQPPDKRIDEVLMNAKESTKLAYVNRDNIQNNTQKVPENNITSQEKLDLILKNLKECCELQTQGLNLANMNLMNLLALILGEQQANQPNGEFAGLDRGANAAIVAALETAREQVADMFRNVIGRQNGGLIYAQEGTLVNYQPKGTDTVPAMLTPGEFVVNRQATQQHLPLLQSINDGHYSNGGIVYAQNGGKINVKDQDQLQGQMSLLGNALLPFTSGSKGKQQLLALFGRGLDIGSYSVGKPAIGTVASYMTNTDQKGKKSGQVIFKEQLVGATTVRHEMAHAIAHSGHNDILRGFANNSGLIQELKNSNYEEIGGYAIEELVSKPAEMFAVLASDINRIGPKARQFIRLSMKALGYQAGGMVYAAGGGSIPKLKLPTDFGLDDETIDNWNRGPIEKILNNFMLKRNGGEEPDPDSILGSLRDGLGMNSPEKGWRGWEQDYFDRDEINKKMERAQQNPQYGPIPPQKFDHEPLSEKFKKAGRNIGGMSTGGLVYAQNGMEMPLPDPNSRQLDSYVPFKTLRDKELAQRKQAAEQRKRMLAAQAQLAQGARYYMNQDEMERRQREENSPKAARERQQKAIDRAQQPKAGSAGFGNAGIQYQKTGGVIYANNGMLIPYRPQGTDTVPAMLTPGEFVVNRQATQQHLPLLHAINDGYYQNGGVVYAEDGAFIPYRSKYHENSDQKRKAYEKEMQRRSDAREAERTRRAQYANEAERRIVENQQRMQQPAQLAAAMPQQQSQQMMMANRVNQAAQMAFNPQSFGNINQQFTILGTLLTGVNQTLTQFGAVLQGFQQPGNIAQVRGGNNGVPNGIADFIKSMNNLVQQLQNVGGQIPETINLAMQPARITVDITGAQLLASLQPTIQGLVIGQIDASMKDWVANNLDGIEPPNFGGSSSYA